MGKVPNIYAAMAHSPVALKSLLAFGENLGQGNFNLREKEAIALAVGEANQCFYCLAAHTALAKMQGLREDEALSLRKGTVKDAKLKALTELAKAIVLSRGNPDKNLIDDFFSAGYDETALVEVNRVHCFKYFYKLF